METAKRPRESPEVNDSKWINSLFSSEMLNEIGRSVGGGPMRSRSRNIDTSPYSNNAYLSPPQESSWRRTSSDSAIHQSLAQNQVRKFNGTRQSLQSINLIFLLRTTITFNRWCLVRVLIKDCQTVRVAVWRTFTNRIQISRLTNSTVTVNKTCRRRLF